MAIKVEKKRILLNVRDLVQFSPSYNRFPLYHRGVLGKQAQKIAQQQRSHSIDLFKSEYPVLHKMKIHDSTFIISGKIDSIYEFKTHVEVEEIKSVILSTSDFKVLEIETYPEFREQVLFYSYLLHDIKPDIQIKPIVTIINLGKHKRKSFKINFNPQQVKNLLYSRCEKILSDIKQKQVEEKEQKQSSSKLKFPFSTKHPPQVKMIKKVDFCLQNQKDLLLSAPTGVGKTVAALYPCLKYALRNGKSIFFLTSKSTQQKNIGETLFALLKQDAEVKAVFLRAAREMCVNDNFICHEDFCPYIRDYHSRLISTNILEYLLLKKIVYPDSILELSVANNLCPLKTMHEVAKEVDLIVGDYNYIFDRSTSTQKIFQNRYAADWILIIDEVHNLHHRCLDLYSQTISRRFISELITLIKKKKEKIYTDLRKSLATISTLLDEIHQGGEIYYANQNYFIHELEISRWKMAFAEYEAVFIQYLIQQVKRKKFLQEDPLEQFYYQLYKFINLSEIESDAFQTFYKAEQGGAIKIQCCDPSQQISERLSVFYATIAMSATLDPIHYYQNVLGFLPERTILSQLDSPFPPENRKIIVIPGISTRFSKRSTNYPQYANIIKNIIQIRGGNYLAFFPSYEFLQNVNLFLGTVSSEKYLQKRNMKPDDKQEIIENFRDITHPKLLLAVMGGIFSEGVDFIGNMCIGVIIFSPAIPAPTFERELIREYYANKNEAGFDYAYTFPAMNKVIQAVGRLIRTPKDKGVIVLVGERFSEENIQTLFPEEWFFTPYNLEITDQYENSIKAFWEKQH